MSITVMSAVWKGFPRGGPELLCMLALADFADDNGGNIFPSMATLADKLRVDKRNVQRIVRKLEADGFIEKVEISHGGSKVATNRIRIVLTTLTRGAAATPDEFATRGAAATPTHGVGVTLPVVMAPPNTSVNRQQKRQAITLRKFLEVCKASGEKPVPDEDPIFDYADKVGIEDEMLNIAWVEFKAYWLPTDKKKADWPATYRNFIRNAGLGLWTLKQGEQARWTTKGEQARRIAA